MVSAAAAYLKARQAASAVAAGTSHFGGTRLDATLVPRLHNALLDAENGVALTQTLFAFIGDSTMAGTRGAGDLKSNSYPWKLLPLISPFMAIDENGWYGNQISTSTVSDLPGYDSRLTLGTGVGFGGDFSIGGYPLSLDAATGAITFTNNKAYDKLDLVLSCGGTPSTIGVQFGSGSVTNVVLTPSNYTLSTLSKTLGTEPVVITKVAGAPRVQGMTLRNSTAPKVMLANMAKAGSSSVEWAATTNNRSPLSVLLALKPVAAFINLGINDWSLNVPVPTYRANMQAIITALLPTTDIILSIPFPSNIAATGGNYANQSQYVQVIRDLAAQYNLPLLDFGRLFVSWEYSNPLGRYIDNRHPTPQRGYGMTAKFVARSLRALLAL
ncbi:SGNH/GDSL hydrolase family protein [Novosphingobium sp.]|uniref:SGNH/GDSL hydrolase family protein n=1 Tax=Novosphingobium sp. TaxID=1874826 RepID=UPI0031D89F7D